MELIKHGEVYIKPESINEGGLIPTSVGILKKVEQVYVLTEDNLAEIIVAARHVCTTMSAVDFVEDLPSIMDKLKNKNES